MKKSGYQNSETTESTVTKFGMRDYVRDINSHPKLKAIAPVGASRLIGDIYTFVNLLAPI